jgi:hypothetical protein
MGEDAGRWEMRKERKRSGEGVKDNNEGHGNYHQGRP